MKLVFCDHIVICGWNGRGKALVQTLRAMSQRAIIIVVPDIALAVAAVGQITGVYVVAGDGRERKVLQSVDVQTARSVIVLSQEQLNRAADAESVKAALAVEKIQVSVYTVVEVRDIENKVHFSWTKVDDLVSDEEISVKILAQGIRHIMANNGAGDSLVQEKMLIASYHQMIDPTHNKSQLLRGDLSWAKVANKTFLDLLKQGLSCGVLPTALVGYRRHEISSRPEQLAWISWKTDVMTNPESTVHLKSYWPIWPGEKYQLGVLLFANERRAVAAFEQAFG